MSNIKHRIKYIFFIYRNTIVLYRPKILQNKFEANIVKYDETMGDIQEFINKN